MRNAKIDEISTEVKEIEKVLEHENLLESEKEYYRGKLTGLNYALRVLGYSDL